MGDRQRSWDHSFACAWHDGEPCTCKDASDRPLTTGEGTGLDKTPAELLAEMRAFALTLPDDLGPLFGRDVARMCDECGRLRAFSKRANDNCVSLSEQLDAARQALEELVAAGLNVPVVVAGENQRERVRRFGEALDAARAALGVEGPAAGDGQP